MNKKQIINNAVIFVKKNMKGDSSHDWWHIYRVWQTARYLAHAERVDSFLPEIASIFHDIADWKFNKGDEMEGPKIAGKWLATQGFDTTEIQVVQEAIHDVSFVGAGVLKKPRTKIGEIVQDADRLDALGAIGIARTFAFGGYAGVGIYNPEKKPVFHKTDKAYKKNISFTINHFYEKLLLLKDRMNTKTARNIAQKRHLYMEKYLIEFYNEWKLRDIESINHKIK